MECHIRIESKIKGRSLNLLLYTALFMTRVSQAFSDRVQNVSFNYVANFNRMFLNGSPKRVTRISSVALSQ